MPITVWRVMPLRKGVGDFEVDQLTRFDQAGGMFAAFEDFAGIATLAFKDG